jgi:hypothetical protein
MNAARGSEVRGGSCVSLYTTRLAGELRKVPLESLSLRNGSLGRRSQALLAIFSPWLRVPTSRILSLAQPSLEALPATACATKMVPSGIFARDAGRRQRTTNALHPRLSRAGDVSRAVWEVPA